jgi:hypothetical protein
MELSSKGSKMDLGVAAIKTDRSLPQSAQAGELFETLKRDLAFTGLFTLVEGGPSQTGSKFAGEWSRLGANVVCLGSVEKAMFGRTQFAGELRDVNTGLVVLSKKFVFEEAAGRLAHRWADEIVRYFTGQPGIASSRVVFVNDATGKKEVCLADADGGNFQRLTNDRSIALFPKLSPDGAWIIFTSFRDGRPAIHRMRSDGSDRRVVCKFDGLNSAAAWMPDGQSIVGHVVGRAIAQSVPRGFGRKHSSHVDSIAGGGYGAHRVPGRVADRVHLRPAGRAPNLRDGRHRGPDPTGRHRTPGRFAPLVAAGAFGGVYPAGKALFRSVDVGSGHRPTVAPDVRRGRQRKRVVVAGRPPCCFFQHAGRPAGVVGDGRGRVFPAAIGRVSRAEFYPPLGILKKGFFYEMQRLFVHGGFNRR